MLCNGVVYVDDITFIFKRSASFLSEPGVCEQPELVALLFAHHLFSAAQKRFTSKLGAVTSDNFFVSHVAPPSMCFTFLFSFFSPCPL